MGMPLCFVLLASVLCLGAVVGGPLAFPVPSFAHLEAWAPMLFLNAFIAFALNVVIAAVIQKVSSVGFLLAGIAKDALIVLCGCLFLGEEISRCQGLGFALQLQGTLAWTVLKSYPEEFEAGMLEGLKTMSRRMIYGRETKRGASSAAEPDVETPSDKLLAASAPRSYGSNA